MANYYVIGNNFKPYTFDELIKPLQIYGEAYKEQEAALEKTQEQRFKDSLVPGSQAATIYQAAEDNLREISDELATQGLSSGLRGRIKSAAKDYTQTMQKLTTAQGKLDDEIKRRLTLGEDYVHQDNDLSLDSFLQGKTVTPKQVSLSGTTKAVAAEAEALAQSLMRDPVWDKVRGTVGYYQVAQAYGLDNADIAYVTQRDSDGRYLWETSPSLTNAEKEKFKKFTDIANSKRKAVEYDKYDPNDRAKIDDAINSGMYAALGQTKYTSERDVSYETPSQVQARKQGAALFGWQYDVDPITGDIRGYNPAYEKAQLESKGYTYDEEGNLVKVGTTTTSSDAPGKKGSTERVGRITEPVKINVRVKTDESGEIIKHKSKDTLTSTIDKAKITGKLRDYITLTPYQQSLVLRVIGEDDPINYTFYTDGDDIIVSPKATKIVSPSGQQGEADEDYAEAS